MNANHHPENGWPTWCLASDPYGEEVEICPDCGRENCKCPVCEQCGEEMNPVSHMMGPVCLKCCRENHRKATGGAE